MKWEMEIDEIEGVLEKVWDLHDKLSDAIHSISRAHFLNSIKAQRNSDRRNSTGNGAVPDDNRGGFVFVKDLRVDASDFDSAIQEAKSLNAIRTALENLEDQLEIFHTVQVQQRAERDAAIARLEQSRIVLAMRLAEHQGKKYKVIEEALAFVGDVEEANRFVTPEKLYSSPFGPSDENLATCEGKRPNILCNILVSSFNFARKSLKLDFLGGVLGNAALVTISMVALLHMHQVTRTEHQQRHEDDFFSNRRVRKTSRLQESSSDDHLDVLLARG